jgi:fluoride ion exporter CrcB/FEX
MTWIAVTFGGPPGSLVRYGVSHLVRVRGLPINGFIAVWLEYQFGARST